MLRHSIRYEYICEIHGFPGAEDLVYMTIKRDMFDNWAFQV
jgi:hypothetical protein